MPLPKRKTKGKPKSWKGVSWWEPVEKRAIHSFPRPVPSVVLTAKEAGVSSFATVQALQARLLATPGKHLPVVHAGALDPFATGLLPVLVGSSARLFEWVHELPKTYRATVAWGRETDTLDAGGKVVREAPPPTDAAALDAALATFLGWTQQVPPSTSNKRVDGERAWQKAHRGEEVHLPPSRVYLHSARWMSHELPNTSLLELTCRGGFYVRSLARDVAQALGTAAHLVALERTEVGPWYCPRAGHEEVLTGEAMFTWWPSRRLTDAEWGALRAGTAIPRGRADAADWAVPDGFPPPTYLTRAFHLGRWVAVLEGTDVLSVKTMLPGGA